MAKWHFKQHDGFSDINQSSSSEAFEGSAAKGLATSVVRESVQNVLDVSLDRAEPARVRITLFESSASENACSDWFDELMHHLQQPGAGVPDAPNPDEPCRYLLIEDFNTSGLVGDYNAPYIPGTENNFVNFLYHDGLTGKVEKKLGSRGVGKIVLLIASRARTIFAYTIREGDPPGQPLLVGKSLLKFRRVDGTLYEPAGYFVESWPEGGPRVPVVGKAELTRFRKDFTLSRSDETGLSVVIPYADRFTPVREALHRMQVGFAGMRIPNSPVEEFFERELGRGPRRRHKNRQRSGSRTRRSVRQNEGKCLVNPADVCHAYRAVGPLCRCYRASLALECPTSRCAPRTARRLREQVFVISSTPYGPNRDYSNDRDITRDNVLCPALI